MRRRPVLALAAVAALAGGCSHGAAAPRRADPPPPESTLLRGEPSELPVLLPGWPAASGTYRNPVVAADFPDPTAVRVDGEYWATATNHGNAQPVFQLMRSPDLVNWTVAAAVFPTLPGWATQSWWAPHLVRLGGRFLLFYSAKTRGRPGRCIGVAEARSIAGSWRDRGRVVCSPGDPIDPATMADPSGRIYLLWKSQGAIRAQPLRRDGLRLTGRPRQLLTADQPWERGLVEAPELVRRGGWYVLLYSGAACCGRRCAYALGAARARSPLGPYRKFAGNPILRDNRAWRCPGHGGVVRDELGRAWLLYHAYPRKAFGYVGRQMLLDRIRWRGGWPVIGRGRGPTVRAAGPSDSQRRARSARDDFSGDELGVPWQWVEGRRPRFRLVGGELVMAPRRPGPGRRARLFFGTVPSASYRAETVASGDGAGLGVSWGPGNGVYLQRYGSTVGVFSSTRGRTRVAGRARVPPVLRVHFRVIARYNGFRFSISPDGRRWRDVGSYRAPVTEDWAFGTSIALTARATARFDWIQVEASG